MQLRDVVDQYRQAAGGYGRPVPLSSFGLDRAETERVFSLFDEDYHISRFFRFTHASGGEAYQISGFPQTHVAIDAGIEAIL